MNAERFETGLRAVATGAVDAAGGRPEFVIMEPFDREGVVCTIETVPIEGLMLYTRH